MFLSYLVSFNISILFLIFVGCFGKFLILFEILEILDGRINVTAFEIYEAMRRDTIREHVMLAKWRLTGYLTYLILSTKF